MHELSLVQSIIDIIGNYQARHGFRKVNAPTLQYGELSCINQQSLAFAFDVLAEGTVAEGSRLHFRKIPPKVRCEACGGETLLHPSDPFECGRCGSPEVTLIAGMEELTLLELDVD